LRRPAKVGRHPPTARIEMELTAEEWDWFKHLARVAASSRTAPAAVRRRLLELKLLEEKPGGTLAPTPAGRDVLRLVDHRPRRGWRRR
jgi:hypothetical protein